MGSALVMTGTSNPQLGVYYKNLTHPVFVVNATGTYENGLASVQIFNNDTLNPGSLALDVCTGTFQVDNYGVYMKNRLTNEAYAFQYQNGFAGSNAPNFRLEAPVAINIDNNIDSSLDVSNSNGSQFICYPNYNQSFTSNNHSTRGINQSSTNMFQVNQVGGANVFNVDNVNSITTANGNFVVNGTGTFQGNLVVNGTGTFRTLISTNSLQVGNNLSIINGQDSIFRGGVSLIPDAFLNPPHFSIQSATQFLMNLTSASAIFGVPINLKPTNTSPSFIAYDNNNNTLLSINNANVTLGGAGMYPINGSINLGSSASPFNNIVANNVVANNLTFGTSSVANLTVQNTTNGPIFRVNDNLGVDVLGVDTSTRVVYANNVSINPLSDGKAFTINNSGGSNVLTVNTSNGLTTMNSLTQGSTFYQINSSYGQTLYQFQDHASSGQRGSATLNADMFINGKLQITNIAGDQNSIIYKNFNGTNAVVYDFFSGYAKETVNGQVTINTITGNTNPVFQVNYGDGSSFFSLNNGAGACSIYGNVFTSGSILPLGGPTVGNSQTPWYSMYAVNFINVSDERLKNNIEENDLGLDFINKISTKKYYYNQSPTGGVANGTGAHHRGIIAQDIAPIAGDFAGLHAPSSTGDYYGVDYNQFVPVLIKAVQELSQEVNSLKAQLHSHTGTHVAPASTPPIDYSSVIASLQKANTSLNVRIATLEGKNKK